MRSWKKKYDHTDTRRKCNGKCDGVAPGAGAIRRSLEGREEMNAELKAQLEDWSIYLIRMAAKESERRYGQPIVVGYSGGKDSDIVVHLCEKAGVPFEVMHNITTVDAPETFRHVRKLFERLRAKGITCIYAEPTYKGERTNMYKLIVQKKMPPTRLARYCCEVFKEAKGTDRVVLTGVRKAESRARSDRSGMEIFASKKQNAKRFSNEEIMLMNDNDESRKEIDQCIRKGKIVYNPIIEWTNSDVWEYIRDENIRYNPLYDRGYTRIGCIGCPMGGRNRYKEFADYPGYKRRYIQAFDDMLKMRAEGGNSSWKTGEDVYRWWMQDKNIEGQISLEDIGMGEEE